MEISDALLCLYSGRVEEREGSFVIEMPEEELTVGDVSSEEVYRIALVSSENGDADDQTKSQTATDTGSRNEEWTPGKQCPPVGEGERRTVDIEDIGEQGDGIARVERGYVVIVPDTEQGERVTIEITDVRENMGFAEVVERDVYYE